MVAKISQFNKVKRRSFEQLGQKAEFFVSPLSEYKSNYRSYKSEKINSLASLTELGIPTVPFPYYLKNDSYLFYYRTHQLNPPVINQLRDVFQKIKSQGYNLTVRPSVFDPNIPGFEFIVPNAVNLPTFTKFIEAIKTGYDKLIAESKRPEVVEFVYIIQGFYTSNRCGLAQSEDGTNKIHVEAAFGEHSRVITRGEVEPDIYKYDKKTGKITIQKIATKEFTLEPSQTGLVKVPLPINKQRRQVLNLEEIKTLSKYALLMDKTYGPQEIEWAVLRNGQLIFQATRNANLKRLKTVPSKNIPIYSGRASGELFFLDELQRDSDLSKKMVVLDNLNIDLVTNLTYRNKPAGIILTKGSLMAHATTIIREAKIPSVLVKNLNFTNKKFAKIKETGEVKLK